VADVVLLRVETATDILEGAGYVVEIREQPSRQYPPGTVLAQTPEANTAIAGGATVTLIVANGPPDTIDTPNLLGLLGDEIYARAAELQIAIELITEAEVPLDPARAGRSWQQTPAPGTRIDEGSTVRVWINPA
jgi:serine/threonine-protein kinase